MAAVSLAVETDPSENVSNESSVQHVNKTQNQNQNTVTPSASTSTLGSSAAPPEPVRRSRSRRSKFDRWIRKQKGLIKRSVYSLFGKDFTFEFDEPDPRFVYANKPEMNHQQGFASNYIKTTKYSILTFIPKNLFEQFTRIANFYFLVTAIIQLIPGISPISPITSILPLLFVLLVTAVKEAVEDFRRARSDWEVNRKYVTVLREGNLQQVAWSKLEVGDIVKCERGQPFPADMVFLSTSDPDGLCYIETSNLDGETNLKTRDVVRKTAGIQTPEAAAKLNAYVYCEGPNNRVEKFEGTLYLGDGRKSSLSIKNFLLRGCELRDTKWIYGLVTYTGHETKLMMNSSGTQSKRTKVEKDANSQILILFGLLAVLCITAAIGTGIWTDRKSVV